MKRIITRLFLALTLLVCTSEAVVAQKMKVVNFEPDGMNAFAKNNPVKDELGRNCAAIIVDSPVEIESATGTGIQQQGKNSEGYVIYVVPKCLKFDVKAQGYSSTTINLRDFGFNQLEREETYKLVLARPNGYDEKAPLLKPTGFYIGAGYVMSSMPGIGVQIGGSYNKIDLELGYRIGLGTSDVANWYDKTNGYALASQVEYKLNAFTIKAGYHLNAHRRLAIIPQVGMSFHKLSASAVGNYTNAIGDGSACTNALIGAKLVFSPMRRISLCVAPEFNIAMKKTDTYQSIADAANFSAGGFALNAGVMFHF